MWNIGKDNPYDQAGHPIDLSDLPCPLNDYTEVNWVHRVVVHRPDGSTHEFLTASNQMVNTTAILDSSQVDWNGYYYATDGSNLIYYEDSSTSTYRVLLPDGSRMGVERNRRNDRDRY